jgi:hypothetical protein
MLFNLTTTMKQPELSKELVHTLMGHWETRHTFISKGDEYEIWHNHMIEPELGVEYWINIKYIESLNTWVAFEMFTVPDDYKV